MTPNRWRLISQVYNAAREREPSQRTAFLDQECAGDETLRRDLDALLAEDSAAARFPEDPALDPAMRGRVDEPPVSLEGRQLGPYRVYQLLGAGGMGQVYRARDTRLQRDVALKVLATAAAGTERHRRFAREALAAGALKHPNIVAVYDVGVDGDRPYLISELIDGVSLRSEMERGRPPLRRILEIGWQIAEGLAAAHEASIVHRDLKPENVMVTPEGRIKIVDFGLAKPPASEETRLGSSTSMTLTAAGTLLGTPPYMSPEQAKGEPVDARSDQFSLGVILYELATGIQPFRRETRVQTLAAVIADEPPDLAQASPTLPVPVRWVIQRLLAKSPVDRYAHTADVAAELRVIRDHLSELGTGTLRPMTEPTRRGGPRPDNIRVARHSGFRSRAGGLGDPPTGGSAVLPVHSARHRRRIPGRARVVARRHDDRVCGRGERNPAGLHEARGVGDPEPSNALGVRLSRPVLVARRSEHLLPPARARPRRVVAGELGGRAVGSRVRGRVAGGDFTRRSYARLGA